MGKLEKYLNLGEKVMIGDEEFVLKNPGIKSLNLLAKIMKPFEGYTSDKEISVMEMLESFTDETAQAMNDLVVMTLKASYPDEAEEVHQQFAQDHFMALLPAVLNILMPKGEQRKEMARLKQLMGSDGTKGDSGQDQGKESAKAGSA